LKFDRAFAPSIGSSRVTVIGYAAAAGQFMHASPDFIVNAPAGFFHTKAFIDTGSSGGPVINAAGDIVSIVSKGGFGLNKLSGVANLANTRRVSLLRDEHFRKRVIVQVPGFDAATFDLDG
jgi:hypothetical protein